MIGQRRGKINCLTRKILVSLCNDDDDSVIWMCPLGFCPR